MIRNRDQVFELLEQSYHKYNRKDFIPEDPISIPHRFQKLQDIEISAFLVATLAWGQRKTIIKKGSELMSLFHESPYEFIMNHSDSDLKSVQSFKHRTFNSTDLLYFIHFFQRYYSSHTSLEEIFLPDGEKNHVGGGIVRFHDTFVSNEFFISRTGKHVASPAKKSACKRINMFLRWMIRSDEYGVDFGIWKRIKPNQLICPCDVHVERVARSLGLISRKQRDWLMAEELTNNLKLFDSEDPVKYDFALFGLGISGQI